VLWIQIVFVTTLVQGMIAADRQSVLSALQDLHEREAEKELDPKEDCELVGTEELQHREAEKELGQKEDREPVDTEELQHREAEETDEFGGEKHLEPDQILAAEVVFTGSVNNLDQFVGKQSMIFVVLCDESATYYFTFLSYRDLHASTLI
jgi:hypothetical protein